MLPRLRRFSLVLGRKDADIAAVIDALEPKLKNQFIKTAIRYYIVANKAAPAPQQSPARPLLQLQQSSVNVEDDSTISEAALRSRLGKF